MIGIFDSGIGGMTVARAVEQLLPGCPLLYFGDIARTPYGTKSPETIIEYSLRNTDFLIKKGASLIIIACNTASSVATDRLRREFRVPIIEVVTPAAEQAINRTKTGRIGVIGTKATVASDIYNRIITGLRPGFKVFSQACPLLVPLVEEGWINKRETKMILRRYLKPLQESQIDTLVLGCTHYPLLTELIQARIGRHVQLIDSSVEAARHLQNLFSSQPDLIETCDESTVEHTYYVSDLTDSALNVAARIFGRPMELHHI